MCAAAGYLLLLQKKDPLKELMNRGKQPTAQAPKEAPVAPQQPTSSTPEAPKLAPKLPLAQEPAAEKPDEKPAEKPVQKEQVRVAELGLHCLVVWQGLVGQCKSRDISQWRGSR
jgi:hypothetical protein